MTGFLYKTLPGRLLLKPLTSRTVSRAVGRFMDSAASKPLIPIFIRKYGIDMRDYLPGAYASFNAFFTRRVKPERRPFDPDPEAFCCPCDGLLSAYRIAEDSRFAVKQSVYSVRSLLGGDAVADLYTGGICLIFRLCVNNYHRYHYIDDGEKFANFFLPGCLHTVRPVALENTKVFTENCREYSVLHTAHFGDVTQIEVGAMLVGRIANNDGAGPFMKGAEKGCFLYGGSTVILLIQGDRVRIDESLFESTAQGREVPVRCGQIIGRARKEY